MDLQPRKADGDQASDSTRLGQESILSGNSRSAKIWDTQFSPHSLLFRSVEKNRHFSSHLEVCLSSQI